MDDFGANLRLLCGYRPTITRVAQDLGINRSQLNRYMAGGSFPRGPLLRRICDYFGVDAHEILLPEAEFAHIVRIRGLATDSGAQRMRQHLDRIRERSDQRVRALSGQFFEYYYSMSQRGRIVRALMVFAEEGDQVFYRRLERMVPRDRPGQRHYR